MWDVLLSTTILASFLGGVVALLAPCCVSVMLPAYFASSFRHRTQILAMTLVFAAGVATVILPIALGASVLSRLLIGQHTLVFSIGGALMTAGGLWMLAGGKLALPMPGMRAGGGSGIGATYTMGAFSGMASVCCAPVLAGVAAVSGAAASFPTAIIVGVAYVFGMVAPLCALALLWDRRDWGSSRLLAGRSVTLRLGRIGRTVPLWAMISGGLMVAMGVLTIVLAVNRPAMATDGWQIRMTAWLGHAAALVTDALSFLPGWATSLLVLGALAALVLAARSRRPAQPKTESLTDRDLEKLS
jgi:cytochrome c biogenesis protein CcdA